MQVLKLASPGDVANVAADILVQAAAKKSELTLGLPTGRTTLPWYRELARRHRSHEIDLSRATSFNLDELLLPRGHVASFKAFMQRHSWSEIGLDPSRCDIPDSSADPSAECLRYDRSLAAVGALDLVFVGVGDDGHVAYNLSGQIGESTHVVELSDDLAETLEIPESHRPLRAITVGLEMMRSTRHLVLMATSPSKAEAIRALLDGPEDRAWPCSLLRDHPRFDVVLTRAAAGEAP